MSLIVGHPTGNANSKAALIGFFDAGLLYEFHTSIATFPEGFFDRISAIRPLSDIQRRSFDNKLKTLTKMHPWREIGRLMARKSGFSSLIRHEMGLFSVDAVYHGLDRHISKQLIKGKEKGVQGVYSYEDGALTSFLEAKILNLSCIYDLPIGYWRSARRLLEEEKLKRPEWAATLTTLKDSNKKLERKDKELELADRIFVASTFSAATLRDYPGELAPVQVVPYGFPNVSEPKKYTYNSQRPLKLLFVGGLSQRKGIAQLFEAVEGIGTGVELTVIGNKTGQNCPALDTALARHRWIQSLPHQEILKEMKAHDVFVFPSLFEGFGLVITEAMSQGTPVITTERTAGPDIIDDGENGWIVEAGSTTALQSVIEKLINEPFLIEKAGLAARETAKNRPWEVYGRELAESIMKDVAV